MIEFAEEFDKNDAQIEIKENKGNRADYAKILLLGPSGYGKTYSYRNLDPETTYLIDTELKPFPFRKRFKYHVRVKTWNSFKSAFAEASANDEISTIVIDSQTMIFEKLEASCRKHFTGWDVWGKFNENVYAFIENMKAVEKDVVCIGHTEYVETPDQMHPMMECAYLKGKAYSQGKYESHFTIVLFAGKEFDQATNKPEYFFYSFKPNSTSKLPPDIFNEETDEFYRNGRIYADLKTIMDKVVSFYTY